MITVSCVAPRYNIPQFSMITRGFTSQDTVNSPVHATRFIGVKLSVKSSFCWKWNLLLSQSEQPHISHLQFHSPFPASITHISLPPVTADYLIRPFRLPVWKKKTQIHWSHCLIFRSPSGALCTYVYVFLDVCGVVELNSVSSGVIQCRITATMCQAWISTPNSTHKSGNLILDNIPENLFTKIVRNLLHVNKQLISELLVQALWPTNTQ